jgi:hypothetical protein
MERYLIAKGAYEAFKAAFEKSNGKPWEAERDAVGFLRDDVIAGLSAALDMTVDSAGKWFDNAAATYKINIEGFAGIVRDYLDTKGPGHRVVFLVDEVGQFIGKNAQLMLSLQTITEELGTVCKGRAWVIVTSQEDIDATLGEQNSARTNDFSKITGRFHTRLSLSSSNTDEVISRRLLEKTPEAKAELTALWKAKGDIINNQLSFADNAVAFRGFRDAGDFADHYPFAPYQFQLLQKVFESIRKVGATGRHLARGERSMLDAFQTAAVGSGDRDSDALIPLYDFYPSIESFLDSTVKRAIDQASDNPVLEPWDTKLLRALFLIRYANAVKGTVDNLATLCLNQVDADKLALRKKIESSLQRLESQNLVSRNGELWFFLTNEERDVTQEIKSVELSGSEISRLVAEVVYDEILSGQTKVRHRETKSDYEFNRLIDGAPYKQANQALILEALSPIGTDYADMNDARLIGRSFEGKGRAILRMANDARIDMEIRTYLQIEKYIGPKSDTATPSLKRILFDRKDENRERRERIRIQLSDMMSAGDFYALGQKLTLKPQLPSIILDEMLNYLVSNTYSKLGYIKVRQADPIAEIRAVLTADTRSQQAMAMDGEEGNASPSARCASTSPLRPARQPRAAVRHRRPLCRRAVGLAPGMETVLLVARLFVAGEIKLVMEGRTSIPRSAIRSSDQVGALQAGVNPQAQDGRCWHPRQGSGAAQRDLLPAARRRREDGLVAARSATTLGNARRCSSARSSRQSRSTTRDPPRSHRPCQAIDRQLAIRDPFEFLSAMLSGRVMTGWTWPTTPMTC